MLSGRLLVSFLVFTELRCVCAQLSMHVYVCLYTVACAVWWAASTDAHKKRWTQFFCCFRCGTFILCAFSSIAYKVQTYIHTYVYKHKHISTRKYIDRRVYSASWLHFLLSLYFTSILYFFLFCFCYCDHHACYYPHTLRATTHLPFDQVQCALTKSPI